jgi:hypothetical protein
MIPPGIIFTEESTLDTFAPLNRLATFFGALALEVDRDLELFPFMVRSSQSYSHHFLSKESNYWYLRPNITRVKSLEMSLNGYDIIFIDRRLALYVKGAT